MLDFIGFWTSRILPPRLPLPLRFQHIRSPSYCSAMSRSSYDRYLTVFSPVRPSIAPARVQLTPAYDVPSPTLAVSALQEGRLFQVGECSWYCYIYALS